MSTTRDGDYLVVEDATDSVCKRLDVKNKWSDSYSQDRLLVERSNTVYKCTRQDWRKPSPSLQPTFYDIYTSNQTKQLPVMGYGHYSDSTADFKTWDMRVLVNGTDKNVGYQTDWRRAKLYIGFRNTASTTYYGDLPVCGVQILKADGLTLRSEDEGDWNFWNNSRMGRADWLTTTATITSTSTDPSTQSYYSIGWGYQTRKWMANNYTGSSYAGADGGTGRHNYSQANYVGGGTLVMPTQDSNTGMTQYSSSTGYLFVECSGSNQYDMTWMKTNTFVTIYNGDIIRVGYLPRSGSNSSNGLRTTGTLYARFK